jgi:hypothetical protein
MSALRSTQGKEMAKVETNGLTNHSAALSRNGQFLAAGTFTSDVRVHEVQHKGGDYLGTTKVMELKVCLDDVLAIARRKFWLPLQCPFMHCARWPLRAKLF